MELIKIAKQTKKFQELEQVFRNNKLSHAYLILGEDAESNIAFCKAMIMLLVCKSHSICFECSGCKKILAGFHPDVLTFPKGKSFVVGDSAEILENANIKPIESDYKIILINNFDNSTIQAQNKLLKTIEEAPKNVVFILNAVNSFNVLQTIKSRTQIIEIENLTEKSIETETDYSFLKDLISNLKNTKELYKFSIKFAEKNGFEERLNLLGEMFEILLQEQFSNTKKHFQGVNDYSIGAIAEILKEITEAKKQFNANVSTNLITDNLLIKILEIKFLWNK